MDELVVDGEKYISSKRAARLSGYAKDYIGQLCRAGKIEAKMVGRSWYVKESAIKDHRKTFQGGPVIDDKLWAEGKNGLEFKGFGAGAAPTRPRIDDDNIRIHYEPDPRPLIPSVDKKEEKVLQKSPATALPLTSEYEHTVGEDTEGSEVSLPEETGGEPREQTEEAYTVAVNHFEETPAVSFHEDLEEEAEEDPVKVVSAPAYKRRTSFKLLYLCVGIVIGTAALLSLIESHALYRNVGAEEFEYVRSYLSLWNFISEVLALLK